MKNFNKNKDGLIMRNNILFGSLWHIKPTLNTEAYRKHLPGFISDQALMIEYRDPDTDQCNFLVACEDQEDSGIFGALQAAICFNAGEAVACRWKKLGSIPDTGTLAKVITPLQNGEIEEAIALTVPLPVRNAVRPPLWRRVLNAFGF